MAYPRSNLKHLLFALSFMLLLLPPWQVVRAEIVDDTTIWDFFKGWSIEPGVGLRKASLFIDSQVGTDTASIATDGRSMLYWGLNIGSSEYKFGNSGFGVSFNTFSSYINMDHQWYDFGITNPQGDELPGESVSVGTSVSGMYSYLMPMLNYSVSIGRVTGKMSYGYGLWMADFDGDVIMTPNQTPQAWMPKTKIATKVEKLAYMFQVALSYRGEWNYFMTVGGPEWRDGEYKYKLEELNMAISRVIKF